MSTPIPTPVEPAAVVPTSTDAPTPAVSQPSVESASPSPTLAPSEAQTPEPVAAVAAAPTEAPAVGPSGSLSGAEAQIANPISAVLGAAIQQVARIVKPQAAVVVAAAFGFPLILSIIVVLFLLGQGWFDARDPKLRMAPQTPVETIVPFKDEEHI